MFSFTVTRSEAVDMAAQIMRYWVGDLKGDVEPYSFINGRRISSLSNEQLEVELNTQIDREAEQSGLEELLTMSRIKVVRDHEVMRNCGCCSCCKRH